MMWLRRLWFHIHPGKWTQADLDRHQREADRMTRDLDGAVD